MGARPALLRPGESGLLALDWWNGNRSILVDVDLTGLLLGATLATRPPEIYRALIEATAFGTRMIVESFESAGVPINDIVACGGLPERNPLLMQIYADVTGRELKVGESHAGAGAGLGHVRGGGGRRSGGRLRLDHRRQRRAWPVCRRRTYRPNPAHQQVYDELFAEYRTLHDYFGRGGNDVMKRLKDIRSRARSSRPAGLSRPSSRSQRSKRRCSTAWMEIEIRMIAP